MTVAAQEQFPVGPPVPGGAQICQLEAEFLAVLELYREEAPQRVLEIGTASGGTLYHWLQNAQPGTRVVTVDLPVADYESSEHLYPSWTPDGVSVEQIRGNSHDLATVEACRMLGPFDWLFIDGCHVYTDARQDWDDYAPMVRPGGLVLLHDIALRRDYGDGTEAGVWRLWKEIQLQSFWTREIRADWRQRIESGLVMEAYGIGVVRV